MLHPVAGSCGVESWLRGADEPREGRSHTGVFISIGFIGGPVRSFNR
jgi:hypothetical protein